MGSRKSHSAFTLSEVVVVLLILMIIATLVFPKFLSFREIAKSAEAYAFIGQIRASMERCMAANQNNIDPCTDFGNLDIDDPSNNEVSNFEYQSFAGNFGAEPFYVVTAIRNEKDGGDGKSAISIVVTENFGIYYVGVGTYFYVTNPEVLDIMQKIKGGGGG